MADPGEGRDIVLMRGVEPNMRWRGFCDELIGACRSLNVSTVVTLAALLGDAPHTRPVPVRGTSSNRALRERWSMEPSTYEGPTGIVGVFQDACTQAGLPAASFWAAVPYYVPQPPCPKATLALLQRVEDALDVADPAGRPGRARPGRGRRASTSWPTRTVRSRSTYARSRSAKDTAELPEASGEAIAKEFERYLRRRDEGPGGTTRS